MQQKLQRAKELLPSIIITVLSMIQALALELYWNKMQSSEFLWLGGWDAIVGWTQLGVMLLGIVQIWLMYVSTILRFSWFPSMQDTVTPFVIGLLEFGMVDLMGPDTLGVWFILLAMIYGVSTWAAHMIHRQARIDPENQYFFQNLLPAGWRDFKASYIVIGILSALGAVLWLSGESGALAAVGLLFAAAAIIRQLYISNQYWMHSMMGEGEG
ncbi:MAG: hypothetical protein KDI33_07970 [Halioglobus sp.]|nr:hypothetical protein [Halioglobus sp.]